VTGRLSPAVLVALSVLGGITGMLSASGMRSVVPVLMPQELWGRANAIDSSGYTLTVIVGPAMGGFLVGLLGPEGALGVGATLYGIGAVSLVGLPEPGVRHEAIESIWRSSLAGLRYVLRNRVLRGIATSLAFVNIGAGVAVVAMPVLALQLFHASSATIGLLWACQGVGGVIAGFAFGRLDTSRHAWILVLVSLAVTGAGTALMAGAPSLVILAAGILVVGLATGPLDVTLFSLRQRVTGPRWYGRAIAISMSLNFAGFPVGSGLSGAAVRVGPRFALWLAALLTAAGVLVAALAIPRHPMDHGPVD
jgi:MFS family permease